MRRPLRHKDAYVEFSFESSCRFSIFNSDDRTARRGGFCRRRRSLCDDCPQCGDILELVEPKWRAQTQEGDRDKESCQVFPSTRLKNAFEVIFYDHQPLQRAVDEGCSGRLRQRQREMTGNIRRENLQTGTLPTLRENLQLLDLSLGIGGGS